MSDSNKKPKRKPATHVYHQMRLLGLFLWFTGTVRLHADGDGFKEIWRPWHPVTWLFLVVMVVPCAILGEKLSYAVPMRLSDFWKDNIDQLQWVTPFTRRDTLKRFDSSRIVMPEPAL